MAWTLIDVARQPDSPWKNGGGKTRVLATWPADAKLDDFDARVSIATVETDGPFSVFPGVDRTIALLEGPGLRLAFPQGECADHALSEPFAPFAFPGEAAVQSALLGGPSRDFNLMVRRGRVRGRVVAVRTAQALQGVPSGLLLAVRGDWRIARTGEPPTALAPGHAVLWQGAAACPPLELQPQADDAVLIAVLLEPAE